MGNSKPPGSDIKSKEKILTLSEEQVSVDRERKIDAVFRLTRTTQAREEVVEAELMHEQVEIRHVLRNQILEEGIIPQVREEHGVLIIPVIEEQIEVIRRQVLKEEIHVITRTTSEKYRQKVILRQQDVTIVKD